MRSEPGRGPLGPAAIVARVDAMGLTGIAPPQSAGPQEVAVIWGRPVDTACPGLLVVGPGIEGPPHVESLHTDDPVGVFVALLNRFHPPSAQPAGVHPSAVVDPTARVGVGASIGPLVVIEAGASVGDSCVLRARAYVGRGATLGRGCLLEPGALVLDGCELGDGVIVGAGSVLGGAGFGYQAPRGGVRKPIPQVGRVVVEDGAHIGALCAIDRATLGETRIGAHARIDNHVVVGHNAVIGAGAVLVSQVGVSGSATVGEGAILAAGAGVTDHRTVGAGATVTARASVFRDVPPGAIYSGSPARPRAQQVRQEAALSRLAKERLGRRGGGDGG